MRTKSERGYMKRAAIVDGRVMPAVIQPFTFPEPRALKQRLADIRWTHGPPMKRHCLKAKAKNHSTCNLRLWRKRSWDCLSYSKTMRLSGLPSDTTMVP